MKKLLVILSVLTLTACSKVTAENYDKLKLGMSMEEVEAVIGSADNCSETLGTKSCIWGDEKNSYIKVSFVADNAATFSKGGLK